MHGWICPIAAGQITVRAPDTPRPDSLAAHVWFMAPALLPVGVWVVACFCTGPRLFPGTRAQPNHGQAESIVGSVVAVTSVLLATAPRRFGEHLRPRPADIKYMVGMVSGS